MIDDYCVSFKVNDVDEDDDDDLDNDDRQPSNEQPPSEDGTVTENLDNQNAQLIIDEIDGDINKQEQEGNGDSDFDIPWSGDEDGYGESDFDQENSASINIPKIEKLKGCKTVTIKRLLSNSYYR